MGTGSRTDLVFEVAGGLTYALEFKRGGNADSYVYDLRKLASLDPSKYERIFCALIDAWPNEIPDVPRIVAVEESEIQTERLVKHFDFFATLDSRYKNQVCCVVALWRIASNYVVSAL